MSKIERIIAGDKKFNSLTPKERSNLLRKLSDAVGVDPTQKGNREEWLEQIASSGFSPTITKVKLRGEVANNRRRSGVKPKTKK